LEEGESEGSEDDDDIFGDNFSDDGDASWKMNKDKPNESKCVPAGEISGNSIVRNF
jgi:hypothetical protein